MITNLELYQMWMKGANGAELAKASGMTRFAAYGRVVRHCDQIEADNRDLKICEALDAGEATPDIARRFGVSPRYVSRIRTALGEVDGV